MTIDERDLKPLGLARDYYELHELLRARVAELGIKLDSVDDAGMLPDGQASKLLALVPRKSVLGALTLGSILQALGLALVVVADPKAVAYAERKWERRGPSAVRAPAIRPASIREALSLAYVRKCLSAEELARAEALGQASTGPEGDPRPRA